MYNMIECLRGLVIVASLVLVGCNIMLTGWKGGSMAMVRFGDTILNILGNYKRCLGY